MLLSTTYPEIVSVSSVLSKNKDKAFDPDGTVAGGATAIVTSSVTPEPELPPEVKRILFCVADNPSVAEIEYVVLLSGVVTVLPKGTVTPLIVIPALIKALFGIFVSVLLLPDITQVSNVLFVIVWVCVR